MAAAPPTRNSVQSPPVQSIHGSVLAILSGYSLTTWEYDVDEQHQPVTRFPQGDLPISSFCWNHNRLVLATCSALSTTEHIHHNVMLISSQTGSRLDSFQHDLDWGRHGVANCLQFGGKSRYLCVGDESGAVCLWDLKKKLRVRQFFHEDQPSRQVSLDPTDTYVLSLTPFYMYVYNLRDGNLVTRLAPPGNEDNEEATAVAFTKYCTTSLEPNIVAIGTSDGSVLVYDFTRKNDEDPTASSRPILSLTKRHDGAVTDVAFSYTSSNILVSCGEDGTVKIYDTTTVETIQDIQNADITTPITSMSLCGGEGNICAIGCESGDVFVYNLDGDDDGALLATLNVGGPVDQVQFAPPPRSKDQPAVQNPPKTSADNRNALPMAPTPAKFRVEETTASSSVKSPGTLSSKSASPTAQENDQQRTATMKTYSAPFATAIRKSPLSPRRATIAQAVRQQHSSAAGLKSSPSNDSKNGIPANSSLPPKSPSKSSPSVDVNKQPLAIKPKTPRPGFMKARSDTMRQHLYPLRQQENIPEQPETPQLNMDEFREVVQEEIENLQDEMEEQLRNLHMDMIAQFHQQSQEMNKALSSHLATIDRLTEENKRLREENEQLRRGR